MSLPKLSIIGIIVMAIRKVNITLVEVVISFRRSAAPRETPGPAFQWMLSAALDYMALTEQRKKGEPLLRRK